MPAGHPIMMGSEAAEAVERAFSKQSVVYDRDDARNIILRDLRRQVYEHVERFISPGSKILELNAGTGIDAMYFARRSEEHTSELQSRENIVCRLLLEKKKKARAV